MTTGGRPNTGQLILRKSGYVARVWTVIAGVRVRQVVKLGTDNKAVAKIKLRQVLNGETPIQSTSAETYAQLAERVKERREGLVKDTYNEKQRERLWITPHIGHIEVTQVKPHHISAIYENARAKGRSRGLITHLRSVLRSRFAVALEEGTIESSPMDRVRIPKMKVDNRERAVLTDSELQTYLSWTPEEKQRQAGVLERQTMSALARCFGGLRTGDIHALTWEHFDLSNDGAFTWGMALRRKTARPQKIMVPEVLRPILKDWWTRAGKPTTGLVFPALKGKNAGKGAKNKVSHAHAMRADLKVAFKEHRKSNPEAPAEILDSYAPAENSPRWRELFEQTEFTKPVDFHSWRRKFVQVLGDIGLSAQQAQKLAGHANLAAHERYLQNTSKAATIPEAALPPLTRIEPARLATAYAYWSLSTIGNGFISVGVVGFELTTTGTQSRPSTRLRYTPESRRTIAGSGCSSLRNGRQFDGELDGHSIGFNQSVPGKIAFAGDGNPMFSDGQPQPLTGHQKQRADILFIDLNACIARRAGSTLQFHGHNRTRSLVTRLRRRGDDHWDPPAVLAPLRVSSRKQKSGHHHSHSMVAGGLLLISYTTRLTPRTSLMMRELMRANTS